MAPFSLLLIVGIIFALIVVLHQTTARQRNEYRRPQDPARAVVPELHTVRFLRLPFTTFFKLSVLLAAVTGFVTGVFFSIAGICGARVTVNFFSINLRGEEAILAAPFLCPVLGALCAFVLSLPAWALTNWLLRRTRGIDVTGTIANLPEA